MNDIGAKQLVGKIRKLNAALRRYYYENSALLRQPFGTPPDLYSGEVLGPWPVYIMHSYPCAYFLQSTCTPCFFSLIPNIVADKAIVYESLIHQCQGILAQFDRLITARQFRQAPYPRLPRSTPGKPTVFFGFTTTGTFFGSNEAPPDKIVEMLELIAQAAIENDLNICINIETRAEDVIARYEDGTLDRIRPVLDKIAIMNTIGLESVDWITRNVIYCKGLELSEFERAVELSRGCGMIPNAFVHAGWFALTPEEIVQDVKGTISYLSSLDVSPIVTLPNLSPYTVTHMLFHYSRMRLLDPREVVELVDCLFKDRQSARSNDSLGDPWYIGMGDEEPNPWMNIFDNPRKATCHDCSTRIYNAVRQIRRDYDFARFSSEVEPTNSCSCREEYLERQEEDRVVAGSILDRISSDVDFAVRVLDDYLKTPEVSAFTAERCR